MVLITRIYTRGGDEGETSLGDGSRVTKSNIRIQAIGEVDELNSLLGVVRMHIPLMEHQDILAQLQNDLFDVGADLCWPKDPKAAQPLRITTDQVEKLEKHIDALNHDLEPLRSFVLPGGSAASAYLHLGRTVARRAERVVCELNESENVNPCLIHFLNRLSDFLFVMARYLNEKGQKDVLWVPGQNRCA